MLREREGEFKKPEREGVRDREKRKSVEKGRGKYREGGPLLTKDGVKMEGEKYGKGEPRCFLSLFPSFSFPFGRSSGNTPTETCWKISKFRRWHP